MHMSEPCLAMVRASIMAGAAITQPIRNPGAISLESVRLPYEPGPGREGVLSWRTLGSVWPVGDQGVLFSPAVEALDGAEVRLEGFMMPFDRAPLQRLFLLTALAAHCPFCTPVDFPPMVEVVGRERFSYASILPRPLYYAYLLSQEAFALQNSKLLKVELNQVTIQAKLGSMVAYQGDVKFEHAG